MREEKTPNIDYSEDNEYNQEPVSYCPHCLSLRIKVLDAYLDFCGNCGCTEIKETNIFDWMKLYKERFGEDF